MAYLRVWTRKQFQGNIPRDRPSTPDDNQRFYLYLAIEVHRSCFEPVYNYEQQTSHNRYAYMQMERTLMNVAWEGVDHA